ncbi:neuronal pentraxin receptor [Thalassophryne amazonica]|uniref:neuronal pentraxin receptor n=1 Tax=Thalassophryne amazonica TaxID=390379 RepID=UPI00147200CD|nr:neuronal pentraxin receptor [Thalassophryne amazonica]
MRSEQEEVEACVCLFFPTPALWTEIISYFCCFAVFYRKQSVFRSVFLFPLAPAVKLKFIVIILAAGMVAFIGAVICIIAAVHTGSSRAGAASQQPASDNHSLYPDAAPLKPHSGGSAARAGSLGALHGSETPHSEAPTFNIGLSEQDGVTGLTGNDPAVSRLICTPIPAGGCDPKNLQQADEPALYAGDDWGSLRSTADQLRQTVLQQKDQILTDQRTIRELTGKLSECEEGLDGRSSADRRAGAAGLWGGAGTGDEARLDRIMVRDSPDSVHTFLTVRAVDELEQAITQLKDRIEKLEVRSSRAGAASQQPASDNHSLYPDAAPLKPHSGGSAARAGSLGALHGSETPHSEAPTFNIGLSEQDGVTGLTGNDPAVSRLICTPIPAGGCDPKNLQQADEPALYTGDDWGSLRSTADQLRQTVLQQKDQILTDQRTIRELTGKLSECEEGLDGRSSADRRAGAAGLWGGAGTGDEARLDRIMVRDSPDSVHTFLTVRAVDELEQAITQLKDRIEKLESDIGPFPHNQTDSNTSGLPEEGGMSGGPERLADPGHRAGGDGPWRMEDVERDLEKKMQLLEKERKALRGDSEKHRQEIDHSINNLHHRLSGLEGGISGHSFPEGYRLSFPSRTNYMYAVVKHPIPKLQAFTICMWLRPTEGSIGTPLSYAVPDQPNEVVLLQGVHTPTELLINDKVAQLPLNLSRGSWQHICVSWSQKGGVWQAYQGGKLKGEGHALAPGHHIRPGGVLILGQEQDSLGGGFDTTQALVGELSQVGLWNRILTPGQVASLALCNRVTQGSVAPWIKNGVEVYGGASKNSGEPCSKHTSSSQ